MGLKRSAAAAGAGAAAAAQTVTLSAPAVRDAVRAAVREAEATAAKATAPPAARVPATATAEIARDGVLCLEEVDGRRWSYVVDAAGAAVKAKGRASVGGAFKAVPLQSPLPPVEVRPPPPTALDLRFFFSVELLCVCLYGILWVMVCAFFCRIALCLFIRVRWRGLTRR